MDDRSLHDDLRSLEDAAPPGMPPVLPARRHRPFLWLPAGLALVAGVLIGLLGAQVLTREPAQHEVAVTPISSAALTSDCPVTRPPAPPFVPSLGPTRPPDYYGGFWYGSDDLWAMPTFEGTWPLSPGDDGWYTQKTFWWSKDFAEVVPDITVTGRRLDGPAGPIRTAGSTNASADFGGAMLVGVDLPTPGCWELTATYRGHSLSYVVYVVDQRLQPNIASLKWGRVAFDPRAEIRFLSVVGDRVFASGQTAGGRPAAWYSDDGGESWTASTIRWPSNTSLVSDQISLGRVVSTGNKLVSLGSITPGSNDGSAPGALWFSGDAGASWELSTTNSPEVHGDLASNGTVLVAVGEGSAPDQSEIWVSPGGTSWQQAKAPELEGSTIQALAATSERFLAVGSRHNEDGTTSAMTWESADGVTWKPTTVATRGRLSDVTAGPPALVAAGDIGEGDGRLAPTVLVAAQSFNLNRMASGFSGTVTAVASGPLGIVVGAQALPQKLRTAAWFLPDGNTQRARETAEGIGGFDDLLALTDRFLGLTHCPPTADCVASSNIFIGRPTQ